VLQIICLNRGLKVYDSTLVVPVFYGVYTATGFLDSLVRDSLVIHASKGQCRIHNSQIFNDAVDAYKSWTLFLIFVSIVVLISGVVLLTHKKPEQTTPPSGVRLRPTTRNKHKAKRSDATALVNGQDDGEDEGQSLRRSEEGDGGDAEELWAVGDASDDEDEPNLPARTQRTTLPTSGEEGAGLMMQDHGEEDAHELPDGRPRAGSTLSRRASDPFRDEPDEFGGFANGHADSEQ
jgi:hypothetical protein